MQTSVEIEKEKRIEEEASKQAHKACKASQPTRPATSPQVQLQAHTAGLHALSFLPRSTGLLLINELHVTGFLDRLHAFSFQPSHTGLFLLLEALISVFFFSFWSSSRSPWTENRKLFCIFFSSSFFSLVSFVISWPWLARLLAWAKGELEFVR